MKKKFTSIFIFAFIAVMLFGTVYPAAFEAYDTYTYDIEGEPLSSPTAYSAVQSVDGGYTGLRDATGKDLGNVYDLVTDDRGYVYIADGGNDRIVILNKYYKFDRLIDTYVDDTGKQKSLKAPEGIFITDDRIYVCDSGNKQIVIFDRSFNWVDTIKKPESDLLSDEMWTPIACAVDQYGRIFVVSRGCSDGIIVMSGTGEFTGFIGAQKSTMTAWQIIWRRFQSPEQLALESLNLSTAYNNITIDDEGFVYATIEIKPSDQSQQIAAITSKDATYSPVKKLNSKGTEIMKRNGFFDCGGEVAINQLSTSANSSPSIVIDVACGPEKTWSIVDESRSRVYTYDSNGNLLFAFGDSGDQLGNMTRIAAITYQTIGDETYMLLLDGDLRTVTVYEPTTYAEYLLGALRTSNEHQYDKSIDYWNDVLKYNNNFDVAYIGIGKSLYNEGKYQEAMDILKNAYETDYYSKSFSQVRKIWSQKWLILIPIIVIALVVLYLKFAGYAKRLNKRVSLKVGKKTYWEELMYSQHVIFHPFDGFWDLKHEKRGSVRAGITIVALTIVAFFYQSIGTGYIFNPQENYSSIMVQVIAVVVPLLLWCAANWCLTTLFDGEGSFKDIFIASSYSLAPLPLLIIISTALTNVLTTNEGAISTLITSIGFVWALFLIFFATLVTHGYTLGKNFITVIFTIVAMAVIMFVAILFSSLVGKMVSFVFAIVEEISNRI